MSTGLDNFEWRNQTLAKMGIDIMSVKNGGFSQSEGSVFNNNVRHLFEQYPPRPWVQLYDETALIDPERDGSWDVNKSYLNVAKDNKAPYAVFHLGDNVERYTDQSIESHIWYLLEGFVHCVNDDQSPTTMKPGCRRLKTARD